MDSFVYDIHHTILIEETNAPCDHAYICLPHLFHVANLPFGIHPISWQLSPGNSKYIPIESTARNFFYIYNYILLFHTGSAIG